MKNMLFALLVFVVIPSVAQKTISGVVTDRQGNPLEGVDVRSNMSGDNTKTDEDGRFIIEAGGDNDTIKLLKYGYEGKDLSGQSAGQTIHLTSIDESDFKELSLENLMNVVVVSPSNAEEKLADVPATTIVVTSDEMRERGYNSYRNSCKTSRGWTPLSPTVRRVSTTTGAGTEPRSANHSCL